MPRSTSQLEDRFESWLWRFRLIAILLVLFSLASTGVTVVLGTREIGMAIQGLGEGLGGSRMPPSSPWHPCWAAWSPALVRVLVVAAFKVLMSLPISDGPALALVCLSVLLPAISGFLVTGHLGRPARAKE